MKSLIKSLYHRWEPAVVDLALNVNTRLASSIQSPGSDSPRSEHVLFKPYLLTKQFVDSVELQHDDVFFDVGCGVGRVLLLAAKKVVKKCVGIEVIKELADISKRNAETLRGRHAPIEIRHENALESDYSVGTVFYLFNPFGGDVLDGWLDRIHQSLVARPRKIRIVYVNPQCADHFDRTGWLRLVKTKSFLLSPLVANYYESHDVPHVDDKLVLNFELRHGGA